MANISKHWTYFLYSSQLLPGLETTHYNLLTYFLIFQEAEGRKSEPSMKRKRVTLSSDEESDSDIRHHNKEKGKKVKYNEKPISEAYWGFK